MWKEADTKDQLAKVYFDVICYKGKLDGVTWKDEDPGMTLNLVSRLS